jgi:hypothetical protein
LSRKFPLDEGAACRYIRWARNQEARDVKPQVRAILLADQVYRDEETGKCIIAGTFNRINADHYPATHPSSVLYLNLTDFEGKGELKIRIANDSDGTTLHEVSFEVESVNRLGSCEVTLRLNNLTFPNPGKYSLEVYMQDEYLGHLPLELTHAALPRSKHGPEE